MFSVNGTVLGNGYAMRPVLPTPRPPTRPAARSVSILGLPGSGPRQRNAQVGTPFRARLGWERQPPNGQAAAGGSARRDRLAALVLRPLQSRRAAGRLPQARTRRRRRTGSVTRNSPYPLVRSVQRHPRLWAAIGAERQRQCREWHYGGRRGPATPVAPRERRCRAAAYRAEHWVLAVGRTSR